MKRIHQIYKNLSIFVIGCLFKINNNKQEKNLMAAIGQAGLEAAFQVPMPGDSGSSPDAGSISNYCSLCSYGPNMSKKIAETSSARFYV